jgi:hypothetical protein
MKRTTLWVTVAATGVQLAALGLCAWAMSNARSGPVALPKPRPNGASSPAAVEAVTLAVEITLPPVVEPAPPVEPVAAAEPVPVEPIVVAEEPVVEPVAVAEPVSTFVPPFAEPVHAAPEPVAAAVAVVEPPPVLPEPIFAEPVAAASEPVPDVAEPDPPRAPTLSIEIPRFIRNFADETTVIVAADLGAAPLVFGLFDDGSNRCVDVDNGCYAGKAEGMRSRMREVAGSRAFTVQLEPNEDGSYAASFIGGLHDAQSMLLLPVAGASKA